LEITASFCRNVEQGLAEHNADLQSLGGSRIKD